MISAVFRDSRNPYFWRGAELARGSKRDYNTEKETIIQCQAVTK